MNAYLLLANGIVFAGQSVGAEGVTVGEVVFATGMVGFEETLTDPSYYGQIITQTYPLIGNYGMNKDDMESDRIWAKGYIVREACTTPSNWRCEETLDSFLKKNNTIGIEGIDTRHLTRIIRESGVMNGAILTTFDPADPANKAETEKLLETIRAYAVTDAVKSVTCEKPEVYNEKGETHIVLMHYGCNFQLRFCQTDFTTLYLDFHFSCDKYDISRNHLSGFRFLLSAAEMCFYFQKKYRKTKRLCNIIICPCFISHDLIHLLI